MAIPSTQEILAALSGSKRTAPIAPIATPQLRPSLDTGTVSPPPQSSIPSSEDIRAVLTGESSLTKAPPAALPTPQLQQTFGDRSFADYAPPNPDQVPDQIKEGLKRVALFDTNGNVVPKKLVQPFLPNTELSTGTPSVAQKIVQALPQGVQHLAEIFLQSVREGPMESLLPTLSRDSNERVRLASGRLEDAGIDAGRAASLAFYNTFSQIGSDTAQKNAARRLAALNPTPEERRILGITNLKQTGGSILDVAGIVPMGTVEKQGLARAIQLAQTMERERVLPTILEHLAAAGVEKTIAEQYAPFFAKADMPTIEKGIASLENLVSKTKATKPIAEATSAGMQTVKTTEESAKLSKEAIDLQEKYGNKKLPPEKAKLEADAFAQIEREGIQTMVDKYLAENGNVISTDEARELYDFYKKNRTLSEAVHEPASLIKNASFDRLLETRQGVANNTVLATMGGTGAGKSTGLKLIGEKLSDYAIVLDSNLHTMTGAVRNIEKALASGFKVRVRMTYNDIKQAFQNALDRAARMEAEKGSGRTFPISEHITTHTGSHDTFPQLMDKYFDNANLGFDLIDNSGKVVGKFDDLEKILAFLEEKRYNGTYEELYRQLQESTKIAQKEGRISPQIAEGFLGSGRVEADAKGVRKASEGEKIQIKDRIPVPKTIAERGHEQQKLVRAIAEEKRWAPIASKLKDAYPGLPQGIIDAFAKRLGNLKKTPDIEAMLSTMQRLENQVAPESQAVLDRTVPAAIRDVLAPKQAELNLELLTRSLNVSDEEGRRLAAATENEYDQLWHELDMKTIDRFNEANVERSILEDLLIDHSGKFFGQFRLPGQSWSEFRLDEALARGMKTGGKGKNIDTYLSEHGFQDMEEAQASLEEYLALKKRVNDLKVDIRAMRPQVRKAQTVRGILEGLPVISNPEAKAIDGMINSATIRDFRDISGFKGQFRDPERNFEHFFTTRYFKYAKKLFLDPLMEDGVKMLVDLNQATRKALKENITDKFKINRGSEASAAIQDWGERDLMMHPSTANPKSIYHDEEALFKEFGEAKAREIQATEAWFRPDYDKSIDRANEILKKIYPNDPSKQIPYRKDYFHHYRDFGDGFIDAIRNFMDVPGGIDPKLIGLSEFTKPKEKFKAFAQVRKGPQSKRDAIEGYLKFKEALNYLEAIEPHISRFRYLRRKLAETAPRSGTEDAAGMKQKGVDNFLQFLDDFANDLSGKTAAADRYIQRVVPGGRPTMKVLNMLTNRIKANTMLANQGTSLAQLANIPATIAETKQYAPRGMMRTVASLFDPAAPSRTSTFLRERFGKSYQQEFPIDFAKHPLRRSEEEAAKVFTWLLRSGDRLGTEFAWNSFYEKYLAQTKQATVKDAYLYADAQTRKLVAGRGVAALPLAQKAKITQMTMPFTVETNNAWYWLRDRVSKKEFGTIASFLVLQYLYNETMEKTRGSRVSWDPINALLEGSDTFIRQAKAGHPIAGARDLVGRQAGEALSNIGGGQIFSSMIPDQVFGVKKADIFGQGDPNRFGSPLLFAGALKSLPDAASRLALPFGGVQLKKSWDGMQALLNEQVTAKSGKTVTPIARSPENIFRALFFGPYGTSEAQQSFTKGDALHQMISEQDRSRATLSLEAEKAWADVKALRTSQGADAAAAQWSKLKEQPELFAAVKQVAADEEKGLTANDRLVLQLGVSNGARARYVVDQIESLKTKEERQQLWIEYTKKKILTPDVAKQAEELLNKELVK